MSKVDDFRNYILGLYEKKAISAHALSCINDLIDDIEMTWLKDIEETP